VGLYCIAGKDGRCRSRIERLVVRGLVAARLRHHLGGKIIGFLLDTFAKLKALEADNPGLAGTEQLSNGLVGILDEGLALQSH